ncbi:MAG: hypothetical protein D5R98_04695 [Desulfonatronovibrio sp. MSAO_Bac4]|nr:MAG: hypothetical protein D5R98_04695 [Desulfonatronovibrio sp. MSAO_Bac4]
MKKVKVMLLSALFALVLLFMVVPVSHGQTGTYIDCIHGCPDLPACNNCCNESFRVILRHCDDRRDQCDALCPPGDMDCLDGCSIARSACLMQDMRDFDCPHWVRGRHNMGFGSGAGASLFSTGSVRSSSTGCAYCH